MKCFYCGRELRVLHNDEGMVMVKCGYPRCRLKPESDWEPNLEMAEADIEMIKKSMKGK